DLNHRARRTAVSSPGGFPTPARVTSPTVVIGPASETLHNSGHLGADHNRTLDCPYAQPTRAAKRSSGHCQEAMEWCISRAMSEDVSQKAAARQMKTVKLKAVLPHRESKQRRKL
ncbi:hypothetical protein K9U40_05325, partial [Xanthobacter autotrophicus]|uniref:hypothetical protein n=1 Tax=Xanthobacter autotrophicus TaxID=280 RepID=UPI0024AC4147